MNRSEFLNQFNLLYNNTTSNQAPDLNCYEISMFLTNGAEELVKNYFSPNSNKLGQGFNDSKKRYIDFSTLIVKKTLANISSLPNPLDLSTILPAGTSVIAVLDETIKEDSITKVVTTISPDEYSRLLKKPYPLPLKKEIWKVLANNQVTFIGHGGTLNNYEVRYVKKPNPIIVGTPTEIREMLDNNLTIGGYPTTIQDTSTTSNYYIPDIDIPEELHKEVVQRAVELAKAAWQGDLSTTVQMGQRSE